MRTDRHYQIEGWAAKFNALPPVGQEFIASQALRRAWPRGEGGGRQGHAGDIV